MITILDIDTEGSIKQIVCANAACMAREILKRYNMLKKT